MRKKIEDAEIGPDMSAGDIVRELGRSGVFGAGRTSKAANVLQKMIESDATVFLGLAGAMVPGGMRRVVAEMVRDGMVDVLVSTGANVTHDLMCCFGIERWRDLAYSSDAQLRERGLSRILDAFIDEKGFTTFEKKSTGLLDSCLGSRGISKISPSELLFEMGLRVQDESSIIRNAAEAGVPIFVPAFTDSILGMQTYFYSQTHPLILDVLRDLGRIIDLAYKADPSGAVLIGGGVPKNFIFQSKLVAPKGFDFSVQITTDRPEPGGLSGATLDEAISWGKVDPGAQTVTVYGDATIVLPLIVAAVRERLGAKLPRRGRRR